VTASQIIDGIKLQSQAGVVFDSPISCMPSSISEREDL